MSKNLPLVLLPLGLVLLVVLLFAGSMPVHEWKAWNLSRALGAVRHPAGTSHVTSQRRVGLLLGNGNHCDFFAGELRKYSGTREQLQAAYAGMTVPSPFGRYPEEVRIAFFEAPEARPLDLPSDFDEPGEWDVPPSEAPSLYLVYLFNGGHETGYDLRCH